MLTLRCMSPTFWGFDKEQDTKCLIMKWNWEFDPIVLDNEISRSKNYHHLSTLFVYKYTVPVNTISVISWQSGLLVLIYIYSGALYIKKYLYFKKREKIQALRHFVYFKKVHHYPGANLSIPDNLQRTPL
jgi:hypothetical protein